MGRTRENRWLSRTVRAGGLGTQQQGRASRLRETGPDETPVARRLRAPGSGKGRSGRVKRVSPGASHTPWCGRLGLLRPRISQVIIATTLDAVTLVLERHRSL